MQNEKSFLVKLVFVFLIVFLYPGNIQSNEDFWVVSDIRISGLQRVSAGSVFAEMPIAVGDNVNTYDLQNVAKTLFKTGQFDDIEIGKDGNILIINLLSILCVKLPASQFNF